MATVIAGIGRTQMDIAVGAGIVLVGIVGSGGDSRRCSRRPHTHHGHRPSGWDDGTGADTGTDGGAAGKALATQVLAREEPWHTGQPGGNRQAKGVDGSDDDAAAELPECCLHSCHLELPLEEHYQAGGQKPHVPAPVALQQLDAEGLGDGERSCLALTLALTLNQMLLRCERECHVAR